MLVEAVLKGFLFVCQLVQLQKQISILIICDRKLAMILHTVAYQRVA